MSEALILDQSEGRIVEPDKVRTARETLLKEETYADLAETFRALGDSSRAKIIYTLLQQEMCVCDLAAVVGASESAISQHLRVLRNLRVVRNRKDGKLVYYALNDDHIRDLLDVCLAHLRHE